MASYEAAPLKEVAAMPTILRSIGEELPQAWQRPREVPLPLILLMGLAAAFWPLVPWYAERMRDGSDDPLGVMALVAAAVLLWRGRAMLKASLAGCCAALCALAVVLVYHRLLPPLLEALLAVFALCAALALPRRMPGVACLLALSLPLVASLQFFLGYPLRVGTAVMADGVLSAFGLEVTRAGTQLLSHGVAVGVDPPCSGVRMLWMGCFAAAILAAVRGLNFWRTAKLMTVAVVVLLVANGLRAALLFPSEAGYVHWPHWLHETAGLVVYGPALWVLVRCATGFGRQKAAVSGDRPASLWLSYVTTALVGMGIATGFVRSLPPESSRPVVMKSVAWPQQWNGHVLEPLGLTAREESFAAGFPGAVKRFRCGPDELVLRQVDRATRLLHSSQDCFQASGYEVNAQGLRRDAGNREWNEFTATNGSHGLRVQECIINARGASWHDVGAWFWAALFHPGEGPWMAMTWIQGDRSP